MPAPAIHSTAWVHPDSQVGAGTIVGPFAVVEEDVVIGPECRIEAHAVVKRGSRLGSANYLHEHAVIGGAPQDLKYTGGQSRVRIGDRNVFREGVTVNRATREGGETVIGNDCFFMTSSHVAHECKVGSRVILANCVALAGHVSIDDGAFLSGGVVVHQFSHVGRLSMIGGNGKVTQDVLPFSLVDGVPARTRGLNLVGLRRANLPNEEIRLLKQAFRTLAQPGVLMREKLAELETLESPAVAHLLQFLAESERGFSPFAR